MNTVAVEMMQPIRVLGLDSIFREQGTRIEEPADLMTFDGMMEKLNALWDVRDWDVKGKGLPPVRVIEFALGVRVPDNPDSIALGKDVLFRTFANAVTMYRLGCEGRPFYWRIRPDWDTWSGEIVEYRDDGPDYDAVWDRQCVKDYSHVFIKVRARYFNLPA
jgi:hypothetical protein